MTVTATWTTTFHRCNRLKYQTKRDKDLILVSKRPLHPYDRLRHQRKCDNGVTFVDEQLQHDRDRLKQKIRKLKLHAETLTEIPFTNIVVPLNTTELLARENRTTII